jgi:hypothetical protein
MRCHGHHHHHHHHLPWFVEASKSLARSGQSEPPVKKVSLRSARRYMKVKDMYSLVLPWTPFAANASSAYNVGMAVFLKRKEGGKG